MTLVLSASPRLAAAALLVAGCVRHLVWELVPAKHAGIVSKGCGGLVILSMLWIGAWALKQACLLRGVVVAVLLWFGYEEAQVVSCSLLYLLAPWPVPEGAALCSSRAGIDISALSLFIVALLARGVSVAPNSLISSTKPSEPRQ